jgi:hypothetical protein
MPRIPELPNFSGPVATDDELPIWDKSSDTTYGVTITDIASAVQSLAGTVIEAPDNTTPYVRQDQVWAPIERVFSFAASDETTALTIGDGKIGFRMPFAMTLQSVRASLRAASSSGAVTVNIRHNGTDIFGTALTIDANDTTSLDANVPAVLSLTAIANDAAILVDIDGAGTGAAGLKLSFIGVAP